MKESNRPESGAIIVEVTIAIGVMLAVIFMLLWIAVNFNNASSLTVAVANATRLGATRGNLHYMGYDVNNVSFDRGIIAELDAYQKTGTASQRVQNLLSSADIGWQDAEEAYDLWTDEVYEREFHELPLQLLYVIAYVNESMMMSVGESIRYPCDPLNEEPVDPDTALQGRGCLMCRFIDPQADDIDDVYTPPSGVLGLPGMGDGPGDDDDGEIRDFALLCKFRPRPFLADPLIRLIWSGVDPSEQKFIIVRRAMHVLY